MKCNVKYAAFVNKNMPLNCLIERLVAQYKRNNVTTLNRKLVDADTVCGIFTITYRASGANNVVTAKQKKQESRFPSGRRDTQHIARKSERSEVSGGRVLRSTRYRSGQIRNVTSRTYRKRNGDSCCRRVRLFSSGLLSSEFEFRRVRHRGTGTQKARTARPPQTHCGDNGLSRKEHRSRSADSSTKAGRAGSTAVWSRHSSKNNRAVVWWKKNVDVNSTTAEEQSSPNKSYGPSSFSCRYEMLRKAALGDSLPVEFRSGFVILLRRGMLSWIRSIVTITKERPTNNRLPVNVSAVDQNREIINIFAAMTLQPNNGRAI